MSWSTLITQDYDMLFRRLAFSLTVTVRENTPLSTDSDIPYVHGVVK